MDSDLSHEALERFAAIEARIDKLEGSQPAEEEGESEEEFSDEEVDVAAEEETV